MKSIIYTLLLITSPLTWAALETGDLEGPVGKYGGKVKGWQPEWSNAFFKCIQNSSPAQNLVKKITNFQLTDVGAGKKWCDSRDLTDPATAEQFLLADFKVLAGHESGYKPTADNPKSPNPPALGLFQIGTKDAKAYGCKTPNGTPMDSEADLKVGANNVCCAVQIAASRAATSKHKDVFAEGPGGVMADFWEPMRKQNTSGAKQDEICGEVNSACQEIGKSGDFFTADEIASSRQVSGGSSYASSDSMSSSGSGR